MPTGDTGAEPLNLQLEEYAEPGGSGEEAPRRKGRPFRDLSRKLSPEELRGTGTQKMILDLLDQLQDENEELKEFKERFHERDKEVAVLLERLKKSKAQDIVIGATLAGGSLILGHLPSLLLPTGFPSSIGWIALVVGGLLVVGSGPVWRGLTRPARFIGEKAVIVKIELGA